MSWVCSARYHFNQPQQAALISASHPPWRTDTGTYASYISGHLVLNIPFRCIVWSFQNAALKNLALQRQPWSIYWPALLACAIFSAVQSEITSSALMPKFIKFNRLTYILSQFRPISQICNVVDTYLLYRLMGRTWPQVQVHHHIAPANSIHVVDSLRRLQWPSHHRQLESGHVWLLFIFIWEHCSQGCVLGSHDLRSLWQ